MAEWEIKGLEALRSKMQRLPDAIASRAMRRALRRGANLVRDAARANAQRFDDRLTSETIAANVAVQSASRRRERTNGGPMMRVGVLGGARQYGNTKDNVRKGRAGKTYKTGGDKSNPGGDTWYWRFLEFGTARTPARPFLRSAAESTSERVFEAVSAAMQSEMDKEIKKL